MKAIIVEDEYLAREELSYLIDKYSNLEIVTTFDDGLEAFKFLQTERVDVVFLDINIPSIDGVMLAKNLHQMPNPPLILFTTAYKEHAAEAFEIEAFDYILKPLNEERVMRCLMKLTQALMPVSKANNPHSDKVEPANNTNHLALQDGHAIRIVDKSNIIYASANEKTTNVYVLERKKGIENRKEIGGGALLELVANYSISELMTRLDSANFYRCHRSYCINRDHITQITPGLNSTYLLTLVGVDEPIPVSRANVKTFRQIMGL